MKKIVISLLAILISFLLGMWVESKVHKCNTETNVEFVTENHSQPVAIDSNIIRHDTIWLSNNRVRNIPEVGNKGVEIIPIDTDSVSHNAQFVSVPIAQKIYRGTDYTAYVSGFHAGLDSISFRHRVTTITVKEKARRWNIGISGGYGITPKGFQPYVRSLAWLFSCQSG